MAYGSDQGLADYLSRTGRVLPAGITPAIAREFGSAYVDMFERKFRGTAIAYPPSFPRDIYNPTPVAIEYAAYEAAFAHASGVDLFGSGGTAGGQVVREKVDVLEIQYAAPESGAGVGGYYENNLFILPLAYRYLLPYLKCGTFFPSAMVVGSDPSVRDYHHGC